MVRGGVVLALALAVIPSCRKPKDAVKSDLAEVGYAMTAADLLRAAAQNDVPALKKYHGAGFALDSRDKAGDSALHAAAAAGAKEAAEYLLNRKLPIDLTGASGRTPLMSAVVGDQKSMVSWLLRQGANPALKDADGLSALMLAVREGRAGPVGELAPYSRENLDTALLLAALDGQTEVIDVLTNYGASIYARMEDGRTPLMVAAENGHTESVKLLMDLGAGRFSTDAGGRTASDLAQKAGHPEIAALIAEDVKPLDLSLESPAQIARSMDEFVDSAQADGGDSGPRRVSLASGSIDGAVLSKTEPRKTQAGEDEVAMPPLVMRHYRERELPIEVRTVHGDKATLAIRGVERKEVSVRAGETIPGSRLAVVRVERRMHDSKENQGQVAEVSVVEVKDTATGSSREWIAGVPVSAHDPVALVEDAATGRRYTASPGQRFSSDDGHEFIITDVRSNQLVIEDAASGEVRTIPLSGPKG